MNLTKFFTVTMCIVTLLAIAFANNSYADEKAEQEYAQKSISRYPVPELDALPEDLKQIFTSIKKDRGFIPNILTALAHRPAELRAFMAYAQALSNNDSGLTKAEREMLLIAFSSYNGCTYCVVSHGAALRLATGNPFLSDQITVNYKEADITPRERAIIDFAVKITNDSKSIDEKDFEILHTHGLSDEDIWDIAGFTAFFNLSNRMMNFLKVRPDEESYKLGR